MSSLPDALEEILDRFEDAWQRGDSPKVDEFLPPESDPWRSRLLVELVHIDLEFRLKAGEAVRPSEYSLRFPEFAEQTDALTHLAVTAERLRRRLDPTAKTARPRDGEPVWTASSKALGDRVGRYELLEVVGRGGLGLVYRAWDAPLRRVVAVKLPRLGAALSEEVAERFLREARAAGQLRHPHIAAVHDVGQHEGVGFVVSDFIEGKTLEACLDANDLPLVDAVGILIQAAEALQHAHERGVIHRDVKPSNLMVDPSGRGILLDFGVARLAIDSTLTPTGYLVGTPAYMAPEQATLSGTVDARTDVYGLGATLYQVLTGDPPFRGDPALVVERLRRDDPPAPRQLRTSVPRDLETICLKALTREPSGRYATARAFADDLSHWQRGEPVAARRPGRFARIWRWGRRRPLAAALVATSILGVGLGFAMLLGQWRRAEEARRHTEEKLALVEEQRAQARRHFQEAHVALQTVIGAIPEVASGEPSRVPLNAVAYYETFLTREGTDPGHSPEVAAAYFGLSRMRSRLGDPKAALEDQRRGLALLDQLLATNPQEVSSLALRYYSWMNLGALWERLGSPQESLSSFRAAEADAQRLFTMQPGASWKHGWAVACFQQGVLLQETGQTVEAAACYGRALEGPLRADRPNAISEPERDLTVRCWQGLGSLHLAAGRSDAALKCCAEAERAIGSDTPSTRFLTASAYFTIASGFRKAKQHKDAEFCYTATCERLEPLIREPACDPHVREMLGESYYYIADLKRESGDRNGALQATMQAREFLMPVTPPGMNSRPVLARIEYLRGRLLSELQRPLEALDAYREAVAGFQSVAKSDTRGSASVLRDLAAAHHNVGNVLCDLGRFADAADAFRLAIGLRTRQTTENPSQISRRSDLSGSWSRLGESLEALGKDSEALAAYRTAVTIQREVVAALPRQASERRYLGLRLEALHRLLTQQGMKGEASTISEERCRLNAPQDQTSATGGR